MELGEVLDLLHDGDIITETFAVEIQKHAKRLGESICADFKILRSILERHESAIVKRWLNKSRHHRIEDVLKKAWPGIPQTHRPDFDIFFERLIADLAGMSKDSFALRDDAVVWPYINIEALAKEQPLLIFLSARARNLPWTFARSEMTFGPLAAVPDCLGQNKEPIFMHHNFTKEVDGGGYGAAIIVEYRGGPYGNISDTSLKYCQRQGLQLLRVQQRIYSFLVNCVRSILSYMTEDELINGRTNEELDRVKRSPQNREGYTTFSDAAMLAPYRARSLIDFSRLRIYVAALLNDAKDHLWSLREDPSYLTKTIKNSQSHQIGLIKNSKGRIHPIATKPLQMVNVVKEVLQEAYIMLAWWHVLFEKLDNLSKLCKDGVVDDIHEHFHAIMAVKGLTEKILPILMRRLRYDTWTAPGMRHLYVRQGGHGLSVTDIKEGPSQGKLELVQFMTILHYFDPRQQFEPSAGMLSLQLEKLDDIIRKHNDISVLLSSRVKKNLSDLSVVTECLRQVTLWIATPEVQLFGEGHKRCMHQLEDDGWADFMHWNRALESYTPLIHLVDPAGHLLNYPAHGSNRNIAAMQKAETNQDTFWHHVDSYFSEVTNVDQHYILRQYLQGEMRRTAPVSEATSSEKPTAEYIPLSRVLHDASKQITGVFDRATIGQNAKIKTRGTTNRAQDSGEGQDDNVHTYNDSFRPQVLQLEKRTYKVFKVLFGMHSENLGDVPKVIKWDDFTRAMSKTGFSAEKLQGSAWQFTPVGSDIDVKRSIQFHEPHPESDIPYILARYFGRKLERAYGWTGETFRLA